jgi:hypothetical protein
MERTVAGGVKLARAKRHCILRAKAVGFFRLNNGGKPNAEQHRNQTNQREPLKQHRLSPLWQHPIGAALNRF